jgi:hypothetical protein
MQSRRQYGYNLVIGLVEQNVRIYCVSQNAIFLAKKLTYHSKTNHIDVQYHFVRDMIEDNKVFPMNVDTFKNVSYSLINYVRIEKLSRCREIMGIVSLNC